MDGTTRVLRSVFVRRMAKGNTLAGVVCNNAKSTAILHVKDVGSTVVQEGLLHMISFSVTILLHLVDTVAVGEPLAARLSQWAKLFLLADEEKENKEELLV